MAIQIVNSGNSIHRTTNVVPASSDYTCMFWYNLIAKPNANWSIFLTVNGVATYTQYVAFYGLVNALVLEANVGTPFDATGPTSPINNWVHLTYTRAGTVHNFYLGSPPRLVFTTVSVAAATFSETILGDDTGADGNTHQFQDFREWNVQLSNAQITAEINSPNAVIHTANLVTHTPLISDLLDTSGNGNHWTAVGSVTFPTQTFNLGNIIVGSDKLGQSITPGRFLTPAGVTGDSFIGIGGEFGAMLSDGSFCLKQRIFDTGDTGALYLYDANFNLVAISQIFSPTIPNFSAVASDFSGTYYVNNFQTKHVGTCNAAGVVGSTFYDLSGHGSVFGITPALDNTILYYTAGVGPPSPIRCWDLIGNAALPDLVADIGDGLGSATSGFQMLTVPVFGDVLVIVKSLSTDDQWVRRYATADDIGRGVTKGQLLNTYALGLHNGAETILSWDLGSPSKGFWVRAFDDDASDDHSQFYFFDLGSGTLITNFTTTNESGGGVVPDTCPFFAFTNNWNEWIGTGGTIVVGKASNPLATGVVFTITGPAGSFTIMTDTSPGEVIPVGPGTYSIVETADSTYQPEYFVSNDPVNNNNLAIVVAADELVDVVIVNSLKTKFGGLYQLVNRTNDQLINQDGSLLLVKINWFFDLFIGRDK